MKKNLLNKRTAFICSLIASGALSCASLSAATFYVSAANGNDSWSGLLDSPNANRSDGPFSSLSRAQTAMRNSSVKTATVRGGTYSIASTWQFNPTDNGETWTAYPGENPALDGSGFGAVNMSTGGINNITLQGLTFQNMGSAGISVSGADHLTFRGNTLYRCNTVCISGGRFTNSVIDGNTIDGASPGSIAGLGTLVWYALNFWSGSSGNSISHNMIKNCEGGAVVFGTDAGQLTNSNNIIDRNVFQNVMNFNTSDGGAIYIIDGTHSSTGVQITNNIFDGVGGSDYIRNWVKAIYLDDGDTDVLISGNICRNCGAQAFQLHGSDHVTITNNVFDLSSAGTQLGLYQTEAGWGPDYGMGGNVFQRNILYYSGSPSLIWNVGISNIDSLPYVSDNLYFSASGASIPNGPGAYDARPVYADPQFAAPWSGNYSMPSSSPAYSMIGFQPLATDQGPAGSAGASNGGGAGGTTGGGGNSPGGSGGGGPVANGTYTIRNNSSGLVLDDPAWAPPGAQVIQYWLNQPLSGNQRWVVTLDSNSGAYTIVNQGSGGYLTDQNAALYENPPTGNANQLWKISGGSGANVITNVGTGRLIDDPGSNPSMVGIITWPANGGTNQGWIFQ